MSLTFPGSVSNTDQLCLQESYNFLRLCEMLCKVGELILQFQIYLQIVPDSLTPYFIFFQICDEIVHTFISQRMLPLYSNLVLEEVTSMLLSCGVWSHMFMRPTCRVTVLTKKQKSKDIDMYQVS